MRIRNTAIEVAIRDITDIVEKFDLPIIGQIIEIDSIRLTNSFKINLKPLIWRTSRGVGGQDNLRLVANQLSNGKFWHVRLSKCRIGSSGKRCA
jgi:hypothetical protein